MRLTLTARGRVQGVYYRAHTAREARRLGLSGFARNEPDGTVTVVAEGPKRALDALVEVCRRGSPAARVDGVDVRLGPAAGDLQGFQVL